MKAKVVLILAIVLSTLWLASTWLAKPGVDEAFWDMAARPNDGEKPLQTNATNNSREPLAIPLTSAKEFMSWQTQTRAAYQQALQFKQPGEPITSVKVLGETKENHQVLRQYFELHANDGMRIPGVLQYPMNETGLPAVIVIPGHSSPGESGLRQLVEDEDSYQLAAATKLAQAGYATIAIELRGFGLLGLPNYPEHKIVAYNEFSQGSSYKAKIVEDLTVLHRYFSALTFIDVARIGVTGASLGGELAVALGAAIPSIKVIVFSSYVEQGKFVGLNASTKKQPHYCHLIPRIGEFMRKEDVFKLLAPRATKGIRGIKDSSRLQGFTDELTGVWTLLGVPNLFEFEQVKDGPHEFYLTQTIDFFNRHL